MRTVREIWLLGRDSLRLWWRCLPQLGFWFCIGFLVRELGAFASTLLSAWRVDRGVAEDSWQFWIWRAAETLVFVVGLGGWVIGLVMMIASTRPSLLAVRSGQLPAVVSGAIGPPVGARELLTSTVTAFMAVYALGGFAQDEVNALFEANLASFGARAERFSVSVALWQLYLGLAAFAWLAASLIGRLSRGRSVGAGLARLLARATVMLCGFLGLFGLLGEVSVWLQGRRLWHWGQHAWEQFLAFVPEIRLWSDLELPELLRLAGRALRSDVLPGVIDGIAIPLLWLALTATVFGWHDFHHGVASTEREQRVLTWSQRFARPWSRRFGQGEGAGPGRLVRNWLINQAADYLPTWQSLRLLLRAGVRFAGAFVVVMALLSAAQAWWGYGFDLLVGPQESEGAAFTHSLYRPTDIFWRTLWVAVLVTAFDRALLVIGTPTRIDPIGVDHRARNHGPIETAHGES